MDNLGGDPLGWILQRMDRKIVERQRARQTIVTTAREIASDANVVHIFLVIRNVKDHHPLPPSKHGIVGKMKEYVVHRSG
jgi:hypothetical protein